MNEIRSMSGSAVNTGRLPIILLIEDEPSDVFLFRRVLGSLGYECTLRVVYGITEAKTFLENSTLSLNDHFIPPDLIVSDYKLRAETAVEFTHWLRSHPVFHGLPFVIWSALASRLDVKAFDGLQVGAFLRKTPDLKELGQILLPVLPHSIVPPNDPRVA